MNEDAFRNYEAKEARFNQLRSELLPGNKDVLFTALAEAGIDTVTLGFDGSSDEGCFQAPLAFGSDKAETELPTNEITVRTVIFDTGKIENSNTTVTDYLETLSSDLLNEKHAYWEDGEGAYGEFQFSVPGQTITLEYNERYTDHHYHEYKF